MPASIRHIARRLAAMLTLALACALPLTAAPSPALAETRTTDIVLGKTAEERDIDTGELPDISAAHALIVSRDGTLYFERDADTPVKIASITKVMTAIVALEHSQLGDTVTVSHAAATVGESSAYLKEGDSLSMELALRGLLIPSGNDAAIAIAETVGRTLDPASADPVATFVSAMNAKAKELGCKDTLFTNPHGLDFGGWESNMHATARDVATMYAYAMKNEAFRAIVNSQATDLTVTGADGAQREIHQKMHNVILGQEGNIGGKTGTTYDAGYCFVSGYTQETGGEVYVVVLGSSSDEQRFADTAALAHWYYGHWATVPLAHTNAKLGDQPIVGRVSAGDWSDRTVAATLEQPDQTAQVFSLAGAIEQKVDLDTLTGTISAGQKAGRLTYTQGGNEIVSAKLVTAEGQAAPNPLEWLMVQLDRLVRLAQGKPSTAEAEVLNTVPDPLAYDGFTPAATDAAATDASTSPADSAAQK